MQLDAFLRAHGFMTVERPPELWEADVELEPLTRAMGELLAYALRHHNDLSGLVLNASNVTIESEGPRGISSGDYVALTVRGPGAWKDVSWIQSDPPTTFDKFGDLAGALTAAGAVHAYARDLGPEGGSITVLYARLA
jgi:hypothetical protein